jgi:PAS domain S-box-containing protein
MEKLFHAHRPEGADALREDKEVEEIAVDILEELDRLYGFIFTPSESEVLSRRLRCLLNAIVAAVHDDAQLAPLLETVEVLATTFFDKGITVSLWDGIINSIFKKLACVAALADSLNQLEMLRIKALLSLFQTGSHFQAQKRIFMELENENVQYICDLLVVSFDLGQIKKILDEKLVAIHIPETYISFYEPGQKDASLLYSYFGRDDDPMAKEVFPASELIPGGIAGRSGSYCVMPMGTDKEEFGFVVFKTADMQGSKYDTLADKIASAVNGAHLVEKVRQQNVALSKSEENLRITLNSIGDAVVVTDTGGTITSMNPVAEELTGWMFMQALGRPLGEVFNVAPDQSKTDLRDMMDTVIGQGIPFRLPGNCILVSKENSEIRVNYSGAPLRNTEGSIIGSVIIFRDITEQFIMEEKLRQTQKMDAIGQLAGGVAHDFNNMLAGIMGYAELIALQTGIDDPIGSYARKIFETAQNTAELNKKLLTYSRKAKRQSLPVDVHVCINDAIQILEHSLDRRIIIHRDMKADVTVVRGDASQVQNAILNLALNARDAMHEGGDLTFSSVNVVLDREFCETSPFDLHPGLFIEISVCDTGIGMDPETQSKIFHPFFTTKEVGKGTGLGLAAVYGIVRDHRGAIKVYSELNKGTVFKVYLPADPTLTLPEKSAHEVAHTGTGCVLVIDDEKIIRDVLTLQLREMGYSVLTAQDGIEGVTTYQNNCSTIDMVILDIVMPKMSGPDTFTAIRNIDPDAKIVLLSGFSRDANLEDMLRRGAIGFIQKPFKRREIVSILAQYIKNED